MEKRTLLALGLSFLVFFVWYIAFPPKPADKSTDKQLLPKKEHAQPLSEHTAMPSGPKRDLSLEAGRDSKDIKVETELYTAVFSGSGPLIKGFRLKKYLSKLEKDSPSKELVRVKNKDGYGFSVEPGQSIPNINWATHNVNPQGITIRAGNQPRKLIYEWESPQGIGIKTGFLFYADKYKIDLSVVIDNRSEHIIDDNLLLNIAHLPHQETKKRYYAFEGMALLLGNKLEEVKLKKLKDEQYDGQISWIAYEEPYFMTAIVDEKNRKATVTSTVLPDGEIRISYITPPLNVRQAERIEENFTLYLGPRDLYILKSLNKKLEKAINFGWFDIIAKPLLVALRFFNKYVANYGVSIILLTILIKILFWPLTHKSYQSMKEMRKLQPMMTKIREKYKGNKQEMQKQLMGLYKTYKINPMGGCLPMIVQIPVFFALYRVLPNSIELRHAPFILWIKDLSAPDRLFSFPFQIPFMAPPYGIPVLTLIMGASMFIQQKMTPTPGDPAQAKMMMLLPLVFTFLFINFPSGLVLYWLVNNILSIAQQYRISRQSS